MILMNCYWILLIFTCKVLCLLKQKTNQKPNKPIKPQKQTNKKLAVHSFSYNSIAINMKITYQILLQVYIDRFILKHPRLELFCTFRLLLKCKWFPRTRQSPWLLYINKLRGSCYAWGESTAFLLWTHSIILKSFMSQKIKNLFVHA